STAWAGRSSAGPVTNPRCYQRQLAVRGVAPPEPAAPRRGRGPLQLVAVRLDVGRVVVRVLVLLLCVLRMQLVPVRLDVRLVVLLEAISLVSHDGTSCATGDVFPPDGGGTEDLPTPAIWMGRAADTIAHPMGESLKPLRDVLANRALRRLQVAWAASMTGALAFLIPLAVVSYHEGGGATGV